MRFAVNIPNFGDFADPRLVADLARLAEEAGWDGLFVWDHVVHHKDLRREIADPWVLLTAAALATSRIRLGTMITPVARRRVSKLAREITTLDRLTGGRMILGVGLGAPFEDEYGTFGETTDPVALAAKLDEGLFALNELWSGEPVNFHGQHVVVDGVAFAPVPVQRPRVPIWVGGNWPAKRPMRRAARWDGAVPIRKEQGLDPEGNRPPPEPDPAFVREVNEFLAEQRAENGKAGDPFDLSVCGSSTPRDAADRTGPLAEAGATWWQECRWTTELERAKPMFSRVEAGPR
ncbi:MAG TPA: LLM class flavin-dependent oxidoreductase [Streptosporangiaceae bacterium]|nr:LLM class flavin-dependent oxidoreductase [Streptosporangiaceae bacterium]